MAAQGIAAAVIHCATNHRYSVQINFFLQSDFVASGSESFVIIYYTGKSPLDTVPHDLSHTNVVIIPHRPDLAKAIPIVMHCTAKQMQLPTQLTERADKRVLMMKSLVRDPNINGMEMPAFHRVVYTLGRCKSFGMNPPDILRHFFWEKAHRTELLKREERVRHPFKGDGTIVVVMLGEEGGIEENMIGLKTGVKVIHAEHGKGEIVNVDVADMRNRPYEVRFENGQTHKYTKASALAKLEVNPEFHGRTASSVHKMAVASLSRHVSYEIKYDSGVVDIVSAADADMLHTGNIELSLRALESGLQRISPTFFDLDKEQLQQIFESIDLDGDGVISLADWNEFVTSVTVQENRQNANQNLLTVQPETAARQFLGELSAHERSRWAIMYCGGAPPIIDDLMNFCRKFKISFSQESFDW
jgi:hypothetical protein